MIAVLSTIGGAPIAGGLIVALGGALAGGGFTYAAMCWPRLQFTNVGDGFSRWTPLNQQYWIADPWGRPVPDYDLREPYYLVAHAAPMNDPDYAKSWRTLAPDGEVIAFDTTYRLAMRAAQRHFLHRWLRATLPFVKAPAPLPAASWRAETVSQPPIDTSNDIPF